MNNSVPEYLKLVIPTSAPAVQTGSGSAAVNLDPQETNTFVQNASPITQGEDVSYEEIQEIMDVAQLEAEQAQYSYDIEEYSYYEQEDAEAIEVEDNYKPEQVIETFGAMEKYSSYIDEILEKYYPNEKIENISDSDIEKAMLLEAFESSSSSLKASIEKYFESEGIIDDGYNWLKELTSLGISRQDILEYIDNEEFKNSLLQTTLKNDGIKVVENSQGLSDEELLANGQISTEKISSVVEQKIANAASLEDISNYCTTHLSMSEDELISVYEKYFSYCETSMLVAGSGMSVEDLGEHGIKVEIRKAQDGKYYISSDDTRSSFLSGEMELSKYFDEVPFAKSNKSKGEFYDLAQYVAENFSAKDNYSFEDMYAFLTGVEYSPELISQVSEMTPVYEQAISAYCAAENLEAQFENYSSPTQIVEYYQQMLGCTKEEAVKCFNEYYKTNLAKLDNNEGFETPYGKCVSFELSKDGTTLKEQYAMSQDQYYMLASSGMLLGNYDKENGIYSIETSVEILDNSLETGFIYTDTSNFRYVNSLINSQNIISAQAISSYNNSEYVDKYGNFDELIDKYSKLTSQAYGQNILNDKFADYQLDMDTYANKIANTMVVSGLALSFVAGGPFGLIAMAGGFADNAIDLFNLATNEKPNEIGAWSGQFAKEAVAYAIGYGLGSFANKVGNSVCANLIKNNSASITTGKFMGTAAEAALDFGLSYPADVLYEAMLTGEFNWEGNLLGNILGSAMDIKGGIGAYRAFKANEADFNYKFNDGSYLHLENQGDGYLIYPDGSRLNMDNSGLKTVQYGEYEYIISQQNSNKVMNILSSSRTTREILATNEELGLKLMSLNEDRLNNAVNLINNGCSAKKAYEIASLPEEQMQEALSFVSKGCNGESAYEITKLTDETIKSEAVKLVNMGFGSSSLKVANMPEAQKNKVIELANSGVSPSKASGLNEQQASRVLSLIKEKSFEPTYAYQIGRLEKTQVQTALDLIDKGIPASKAADTTVLYETQTGKARIDELINDEKINNYYISDLARLSEKEYLAALNAINKGISAPSAIDNASKLAKGKITHEEIIENGMKKEITGDVEATLLEISKLLSSEYSGNIDISKSGIMQMLFGQGVMSLDANHEDYMAITCRAKGDNSVLCKLIAKYEKGKLDLTGDIEADINAARIAVTDAYGTRLQLRSLSQNDVVDSLAKFGLTGQEAQDDFKKALTKMLNGEECSEKEKKYLLILDDLKEKQTSEIFEALCDEIESGNIRINELNNYGSELSAYFTSKQVATLVDLYKDSTRTEGYILKTVTKSGDIIAQGVQSKVDPVDMVSDDDGEFYPVYVASTGETDEMGKIITQKGAVKPSGYTSTQLTIMQMFGTVEGFGEFQIRGVEVNKFGDIEHIPYDIRQGKITAKDIEYKDIYDAITNMSEDSFKEYNKYLTRVYDYLRCKELGVDLGEMPKLDPEIIKHKDTGESLGQEIADLLSYDGLLKYAH